MLSYLSLFSPSEDIAWGQPPVRQREPPSWAEQACTRSWASQLQEPWDRISVVKAIQTMVLCFGSLCGLIHDVWSKQRWTHTQIIVWVLEGPFPYRQICRLRLSITAERERERERQRSLGSSWRLHFTASLLLRLRWRCLGKNSVLLLCFSFAFTLLPYAWPFWDGCVPASNSLQHQLGVPWFTWLLTRPTWRQLQTSQVTGSVPQDCSPPTSDANCKSRSQVLLTHWL